MPLRWHALYQKLLAVATRLVKKVLPLKLCQKVAELMEIDNESFGEALNFFDGLKMLFDIPPQLVFMETDVTGQGVRAGGGNIPQRQGKKGEAMPGVKVKVSCLWPSDRKVSR